MSQDGDGFEARVCLDQAERDSNPHMFMDAPSYVQLLLSDPLARPHCIDCVCRLLADRESQINRANIQLQVQEEVNSKLASENSMLRNQMKAFVAQSNQIGDYCLFLDDCMESTSQQLVNTQNNFLSSVSAYENLLANFSDLKNQLNKNAGNLDQTLDLALNIENYIKIITQLSSKVKKYKRLISELKTKYDGKEAELQKATADIQNSLILRQQQNQELDTLKSNLADLEKEKQVVLDQKAVLQQYIAQSSDKDQEFAEKVESLMKRNQVAEASNASLKNAYDQLQGEFEQMKAEMELERQLRFEKNSEIEVFKAKLSEQTVQNLKLQQEHSETIAALEKEYKNEIKKIEEVQEKLKTAKLSAEKPLEKSKKIQNKKSPSPKALKCPSPNTSKRPSPKNVERPSPKAGNRPSPRAKQTVKKPIPQASIKEGPMRVFSEIEKLKSSLVGLTSAVDTPKTQNIFTPNGNAAVHTPKSNAALSTPNSNAAVNTPTSKATVGTPTSKVYTFGTPDSNRNNENESPAVSLDSSNFNQFKPFVASTTKPLKRKIGELDTPLKPLKAAVKPFATFEYTPMQKNQSLYDINSISPSPQLPTYQEFMRNRAAAKRKKF